VAGIRRRWIFALVIGAIAVGTAAGCGGSSESEESSTPAEAVAEIGEVRALLDQALAKYRAGERADAEEIVGDAYLEHFEKVEGPLEERDEELMEELEERIATTIRDRMKANAPVAEVAALVAEAKSELDQAEKVLEE
jgi:hypothetical protein